MVSNLHEVTGSDGGANKSRGLFTELLEKSDRKTLPVLTGLYYNVRLTDIPETVLNMIIRQFSADESEYYRDNN